jgi:hypothetical protein
LANRYVIIEVREGKKSGGQTSLEDKEARRRTTRGTNGNAAREQPRIRRDSMNRTKAMYRARQVKQYHHYTNKVGQQQRTLENKYRHLEHRR